MPVLAAGAGAGASNTRMLIRKERFAGRDRADPREPCANDVECGGRVGNGGVWTVQGQVEGSTTKKSGVPILTQPRCGYYVQWVS